MKVEKNTAFGREVDIILNGYNLSNLQCDFEIEKTLKLEPNTCKIDIYNYLNKYKGFNNKLFENSVLKINAGYKDRKKGQIFAGVIRTSISQYVPPNWMLSLTAGDGEGVTQTVGVNQTFGPNTPIRTVLRSLIYQINTQLGADKLSNKEAEDIINNASFSSGGYTLASGVTLSDNAVKELSIFAESCNLEISFQDNKLQVLNKRGVINTEALPISYKTGLIGKVESDLNNNVHFDHLITHQIKCGMKIYIKPFDIYRTSLNMINGETKYWYEGSYGPSGLYRVEKIKYKGSTRNINDWIMSIEASLIKEIKPIITVGSMGVFRSTEDHDFPEDPDFP